MPSTLIQPTKDFKDVLSSLKDGISTSSLQVLQGTLHRIAADSPGLALVVSRHLSAEIDKEREEEAAADKLAAESKMFTCDVCEIVVDSTEPNEEPCYYHTGTCL